MWDVSFFCERQCLIVSICYLIDNTLDNCWTLSQTCSIVGVTKEQEVTKRYCKH